MEERTYSLEVKQTCSANSSTQDHFKETFKFYRKLDHDTLQLLVRSQDSSGLIGNTVNPHTHNSANIDETDRMTHLTSQPQHQLVFDLNYDDNVDLSKISSVSFGLQHASDWEIHKLPFPEGLILIRNPFTAEGQRYWISKCVQDYPRLPHITNMENLNRRTSSKSSHSILCIPVEKNEKTDFYNKLRWVTFGYHHDWDTKIYSETNKCDFPEDLALLTEHFASVLGFKKFRAEAAIVNYYNLDSTLSGHQDRSEINQEAPLFSISFGQSAVFLIGGDTKGVEPIPVLLQSGDVVVMSGRSRMSYHGVPRIVKSTSSPWLLHFDSESLHSKSDTHSCKDEVSRKKIKLDLDGAGSGACTIAKNVAVSWNEFLEEYISKCRINLNIRQVL